MKTETVEISSLREYIGIILEFGESGSYYRGESSVRFNGLLASAYRLYTPCYEKECDSTIDYRSALDEYYKDIACDLSEIEKQNFMEYAQHHGLPTPLVDITANPLTALYFAVDSLPEEETGKVYVFSKKRLVDFSCFRDKSMLTFNDLPFNLNSARI
jgi:hypothetical protein